VGPGAGARVWCRNARGRAGEEEEQEQEHPRSPRRRRRDDDDDGGDDGEEALSHSDQEEDDEEEGVSTSAVTRFEQGCRAFRVAFLKIMNKKLPDDPLGPILSAHKKLVAAKLAEEAGEHKPKGEARKERRVLWLSPPLLIGCALSLKFALVWWEKRQQRRAMSYLKTTWTAKRRNSSRLLPRGLSGCSFSP